MDSATYSFLNRSRTFFAYSAASNESAETTATEQRSWWQRIWSSSSSTSAQTVTPSETSAKLEHDNLEGLLQIRQRIGVFAVQGRRPYMEDNYSYVIRPRNASPAACISSLPLSQLTTQSPHPALRAVFGVYDGHSGAAVSAELQQKLINKIETCMAEARANAALRPKTPEEEAAEDVAEMERKKSLNIHTDPIQGPVGRALRQCLERSFLEVDREHKGRAGSTAVVAALYEEEESPSNSTSNSKGSSGLRLMVANTGDSRAILAQLNSGSSSVEVVELTEDHKPDDRGEYARIQKAGGTVQMYGCWRLNGELAMSRAIGDHWYKRYGLIADPDIRDIALSSKSTTTSTTTTSSSSSTSSLLDGLEGEKKFPLLILASDGVYESMTSEQMASVAVREFHKGKSASSIAELIVKTAFRTGSTDNITAMVFMLQPPVSESSEKQQAKL